MNRFFVFAFLIVWKTNLVFSQGSIFVLHSIVGDTVDLKEKKDYFIFPEINDSVFKYCVAKQMNGKFFVTIHYIADSVSTKEVDMSIIKQYRGNIEKLNAYYSEKSKRDSSSIGNAYMPGGINRTTPPLNNKLVAPPLTEEMKNEVLRDERLKSDAERMNYTKQGGELFPGEVKIYNSGNKKKKK